MRCDGALQPAALGQLLDLLEHQRRLVAARASTRAAGSSRPCAASRSAGVAYQCSRCHSGPRSLRNGSPPRKAHAYAVGAQPLDRRGTQVLRLTDAHEEQQLTVPSAGAASGPLLSRMASHPHTVRPRKSRRLSHGAVSQEIHDADRGQRTARTQHAAAGSRDAFRQRTAHRAAVPGGHARGGVRARLLLGSGAAVLGASRRVLDRRRLCGRLHAQSDLRRGLHRRDRPHRSRARHLRPDRRSATRIC